MTSRKLLVQGILTSLIALYGCSGGGGGGSTPEAGPTLVSITVAPSTSSIAKGTSMQFSATGLYSNSTTSNLTAAAVWSSLTSSIATIGQTTGIASGTAPGEAIISAVYSGLTATALLTVRDAELVSFSITPASTSIALGLTQPFTASGTFTDTSIQDITLSAAWSSLNTAVSTISATGLAASLSKGSALITAVHSGLTETALLTVTPAELVSISIFPPFASITTGNSQQFTATGIYTDTTTTNPLAADWTSSNTSVATIDPTTGLASSVSQGTTTISAVYSGLTGSVSGTAELTVTGSSTVTLAWDAPTTRVDGSSLNPATDLSAYKLYYGTASQVYTQTVTVANPGTTTITQTLTLAPGTYYFVVTDIDSAGQESGYSEEISKTI